MICFILRYPLLRGTSSMTLLFSHIKGLNLTLNIVFRYLPYIISRHAFWRQHLTPLICNVWYTNETKDFNPFSPVHTNKIKLFNIVIRTRCLSASGPRYVVGFAIWCKWKDGYRKISTFINNTLTLSRWVLWETFENHTSAEKSHNVGW